MKLMSIIYSYINKYKHLLKYDKNNNFNKFNYKQKNNNRYMLYKQYIILIKKLRYLHIL